MNLHDQLDYKIEPLDAICSLSSASHINHKRIDVDDFVNKYDHDPENASDFYACGDMKADVKIYTPEVLAKYGIDEDEYKIIAFEISQALSFGPCGWCI
jgi:hypothetical protein